MKQRKRIIATGAVAMALLSGATVFAANEPIINSAPALHSSKESREARLAAGKPVKSKLAPAVIGSVVSVSGNTITVSAKKKDGTDLGTVYTVDASNAKVVKDRGEVVAVSAIEPSNIIMVKGTVSGTLVSATDIRLGLPVRVMTEKGSDPLRGPRGIEELSGFTGGRVVSVSSSSFVIESHGRGQATTTQFVTVSASTTFKKNGQSGTIADVATGKMVLVSGDKTADGSSVLAKEVMIIDRAMGFGKGFGKKIHVEKE